MFAVTQLAPKDAMDFPVFKMGADGLACFIDAVNQDIAREETLRPRIAVYREGKNFTPQLQITQDKGWFRPFVQSVLSQGVSVVVNDIGLTRPACRAVETATGVPADWVMQQNLYVTPPEVQGFSPHCDVHMVVVAQLYGRKEWVIYDKVADNPVITQGQADVLFPEKGEVPAVHKKFLVQPGDIFVIPRGVFHDACARGECSVHIAIGCAGIRPIDCIWALASEAVNEPNQRADMTPEDAAAAAEAFLASRPVPLVQLPRNPQAAVPAPKGLKTLSFEGSLRAVPRH